MYKYRFRRYFYEIARYCNENESTRIGLKWLILHSKKHNKKTFSQNLAYEVFQIYKRKSSKALKEKLFLYFYIFKNLRFAKWRVKYRRYSISNLQKKQKLKNWGYFKNQKSISKISKSRYKLKNPWILRLKMISKFFKKIIIRKISINMKRINEQIELKELHQQNSRKRRRAIKRYWRMHNMRRRSLKEYNIYKEKLAKKFKRYWKNNYATFVWYPNIYPRIKIGNLNIENILKFKRISRRFKIRYRYFQLKKRHLYLFYRKWVRRRWVLLTYKFKYLKLKLQLKDMLKILKRIGKRKKKT